MTELEKTAQRVLESIEDFKDSYTYIEESTSFLKIGIDKEYVNIKALSLLYEIIKERVPNIIWGDIERRENGGMCVNLLLDKSYEN
jgi:hypothetical protein